MVTINYLFCCQSFYTTLEVLNIVFQTKLLVLRLLQRQFLSLKVAQCTAAQWSRAHLHQPGLDLRDQFPMKVSIFSRFFACLQVLFCF